MEGIEDLPGEIWKDIPGYEGFYKISNKGRCIRVQTRHFLKYIKPCERSIQLYYHLHYPRNKWISVYKTMYQLFKGPVPDDMCVRLYGNELNANNLELYDSESFLDPESPPTRKYKINDIVNGHYQIIGLRRGGYIIRCLKCKDVISINNVDLNKKHFCACYSKLKQAEIKKRRDGRTKHKYYSKYRSMIRRCYDPSVPCYPIYGGRGIFVCKLWRDSFWEFIKFIEENDSVNAYSNTIDRIDPRFEYAPYNCQLLTLNENAFKARMDGKRDNFQLKIDELKFKRRKRNWIKLMKKQGYKEEDLI